MPRITEEMSVELYRSSASALKKVFNDPALGAAARAEAKGLFDELNADYLDWTTQRVKKRTQAYAEVTAKLEALTAKLTAHAETAGVRALTRVVTAAREVLGPG